MKKQFLLAAVALSLFLLGYGILWPNSSAAMPMSLETPVPTETPSPLPTLTLDKGTAEIVTDLDADGIIDPGDTVRYTVAYENTGDVEATNVKIVDDYDQSLIVSITNISRDGKDDGDTITWDLGTVEAGPSDSVTYEVMLKDTFPPGSINIENTAAIASDEAGPVIVTNAILVKGPNLTVVKGKELVGDVAGAETIDPGDTLKYTIAYENTGDVEATNVRIVDDYDENCIASITNISGEGKDDGKTITWDLGTVEAGVTGSVTYEGTLGSLRVGSTSVLNTATISSAEMDPVTAEVSILVEVAPTPTPEPKATPEPTPLVQPLAGPRAGLEISPSHLAALVGLVILGGFGLVAVLAVTDKLTEQERADVLIITLALSGVLVLSLAGAIEHSAAAGIIGTVVGYLLKKG